METVDSSKMQTFSSFQIEYDEDEKLGGDALTAANECFIKVSGEVVVLAISSEGDPNPAGSVLFERSSVAPTIENLRSVLDGKLRREQIDELNFTSGADEISIGASSVLPSNLLISRERISIKNLRELELDGLNLEFLELSLPPKSAEKLYRELQKLVNE